MAEGESKLHVKPDQEPAVAPKEKTPEPAPVGTTPDEVTLLEQQAAEKARKAQELEEQAAKSKAEAAAAAKTLQEAEGLKDPNEKRLEAENQADLEKFAAVVENRKKEILGRLLENAKATVADRQEKLAKNPADQKAQEDLNKSLQVQKILEEKGEAGLTLDSVGLLAAYRNEGWSGGAGARIGFKNVNPFIDEHLKTGLMAGVDASGKVVAGLNLELVFGASGDRFNYDASVGTVNGMAATAALRAGVYLDTPQLTRESLDGASPSARHSLDAMGMATATVFGDIVVAGGVGYRISYAEGIKKELVMVDNLVLETLRGVTSKADVAAVTLDKVPSLQKSAGAHAQEVLDWSKARVLEEMNKMGWKDTWSASAKSRALQIIECTIYNDYALKAGDKLKGFHFAGFALGIAWVNGVPLPFVGGGAEKTDLDLRVNDEQQAAYASIQAVGHGLEEVSADELALKARAHRTEAEAYDGNGDVTVLSFELRGQKVTVRGPENLVNLVQISDNAKDGKREITFPKGVKAIGTFANIDKERDLVFLINPDEVTKQIELDGRADHFPMKWDEQKKRMVRTTVPGRGDAPAPKLSYLGEPKAYEVYVTKFDLALAFATDKFNRDEKKTATPGGNNGGGDGGGGGSEQGGSGGNGGSGGLEQADTNGNANGGGTVLE